MRRRNSYPRKRVSPSSTPAAEIKSLQTKVKKLDKAPEVKTYYNSKATSTYDASNQLQCLNLPLMSMGTGTGVHDRIGDSIHAKRMKIRISITTDQDQLSSSKFRIIIFNDKQPPGSNSSAGEIPHIIGLPDSLLQDDGLAGPIEIFSINHDMKFRYKVYEDELVTLNPEVIIAPGLVSGIGWVKEYDIPLNHIVKFRDADALYSSVVKNMFQVSVLQTLPEPGSTIGKVALIVIQTELDYTDE